MFASWLMMLGLALIVIPHWRHNERLAFPLLTVQESIIEDPQEGLFAPIFRRRSFWITATAVFALYLLNGIRSYYPEYVPAVPLGWSLRRLFTEEPLVHLPYHACSGRIYFMLVAFAFFMPGRTAFSIWFFFLLYALTKALGTSYVPPWNGGAVDNQRTGAAIALTVSIIWLGRRHWAHVLGTLFRKADDAADHRDRRAVIMFLTGLAGMWAFFVWIGIRPIWALFYVATVFMISILITRLIAETGIPFMRIYYPQGLMEIAPLSYLGPAALFFSPIANVLFANASRTSVAAMGTHAIALDREAGPRRQTVLAGILLLLLLLGFFVCGAVHLYYNYHHSASIDGRTQPINPLGIRRFSEASSFLVDFYEDRESEPSGSNPEHFVAGAVVAGLLQWLCATFPAWPLHPIGIIVGWSSWYGAIAWPSFLVGWMLKSLVLRYGGARLYRRARPALMGLIIGEFFAAAFWTVEPVVRVILNQPYRAVRLLP